MDERIATGIAEHFGELKDPRVNRTQRHKLLDIVVIAICAVIAGADNWVDIAEFGQAKQAWFQTRANASNLPLDVGLVAP